MFPDLLTDDAFRLETRRLWLRWPRVADAAVIAKLAGDKAVSQHTKGLPHPYPVPEAEKYVMTARKDNANGKQLTLVITRKGKPDAVGMISAQPNTSGQAGLDFWIGKSFWGSGIMGEALDEVLALLFSATTAKAVTAHVREDDESARHLLASRGFKQEEKLHVNMPLRGGIFPCGKFRLEQAGWQLRETERFKRHGRAAAAAGQGTKTDDACLAPC